MTKSIPEPRKEIKNLKSYSAPLEGRRGFLCLDFNENTVGPSIKVIKALHNIKDQDISIYPEYNGLKEKITRHIKLIHSIKTLNESQIGIFNGVDAAINAIFHSFGNRGDDLLTTVPTFGYYEPCAKMQGLNIINVPYENKTFNYPFKNIRQLLKGKKPKIFFICNPNNPTGTLIKSKEIIEMAKISPNTLVVIDELYEAYNGDSVLPKLSLKESPNIVVLRSFSKTAGLASLRIGYAIGDPKIINYISSVTGPYDINQLAVTAAIASLSDQGHIDRYVKEVLIAKKWIKEKFNEIDIRTHFGEGNYFLIWPKKDVEDICKSLRDEGILVRKMKNHILIKDSIRISIGTKKQMKEFWNKFKKIYID